MNSLPDSPLTLRQTGFPLFWTARALSSASFQIASVSIGWQVYALTGSVFDLGLVGLVQFIPMVLLTLPAGHVVDRFDRRKVVRNCQIVQATLMLLLGLVSWTGHVTAPVIFLLAALFGAARTFEGPATSALLPAIVPANLFPRAIALAASAFQSAAILGPALGGLLYIAGPHVAYFVVALFYLTASGLITSLASTRVAPPREKLTRQSLLSGFSFIRRQPVVLGAISLDMVAVLLGGATALLPVYAADILQVGSLGLGTLRAAPAAGALTTSLVLARYPISNHVGSIMFAAVAVFGLATVIFGLSSVYILSLAALILMGAADVVSVVIRSSLIQLATPDAMRGRVGAVNSLFIGTSNQLGEFESGLTAALVGAVPAVVAGGVGTIVVALVWSRLFPPLRLAKTFAGSRPEREPVKVPAND